MVCLSELFRLGRLLWASAVSGSQGARRRDRPARQGVILPASRAPRKGEDEVHISYTSLEKAALDLQEVYMASTCVFVTLIGASETCDIADI